ncbi:related to transcription initiation factor TFIIIC [Cephalotrichum gorgonifer]|uniref:Related to transcription initiation factor TFIIIC n=1 Tax=Cephalotrichum gorgonifer TaxID=2041049 RepID=A0AAE8N0S6_9PEZI|nr:related to transcription initiation factor TFIIIC [Cephalotrichum gorgonifer]
MDGESMQSLGFLDPNLREIPDVEIDPELTAGLHTDNYTSLQEGEIDDVDSDAENLEQDIEKLNSSVRAFLASHHGVPPPPQAPAPSRAPARSARKAPEPRGDIKARLFRANRAFMVGDLQQAKDLVFDVIRINAETHQAWTTLSSIFREEGHMDKALMSMVYAAHLKPKDAQEWLKCAGFALDVADEHPDVDLTTARMCYSAAVSADPKNMDARLGRALACHRLGHVSLAVADYNFVLAQRPLDLDIIRKLAEACMDSKDVATAAGSAIKAYDTFFEHTKSFPDDGRVEKIAWYDVGIYSELLAYAGRPRDAIFQLKALSRRLLGRQQEYFWDQWQGDDREFDEDDSRRVDVPEYRDLPYNHIAYGLGLPKDLRARLAIYRLSAEDTQEALNHLQVLNPANPQIAAEIPEFSFLIRDLAGHLFGQELIGEALVYYEFLRTLPDELDADILLQIGRCHLAKGDSIAAEESFLAAIDIDADNIDARVELANLYSTAHEDEEALILVTEAMTLQQTQAALASGRTDGQGPKMRKLKGATGRTSSIIPRRYRPKRLVDPVRRRQEEVERARRLSTQFVNVQELKARIRDGDESVVPAWMAAAKELIDDFRSYRKFYSWDNYLKFLGRSDDGVQIHEPGEQAEQSGLDAIRQRLSKALITPPGTDGQEGAGRAADFKEYQGISFSNWLDLFIDYAISLAAEGQYDESYRVCEAAKDSTVFTVSEENTFFIYIAWGACAIYASDEETCVSIARQIMRDHVLSSDSFRLFSLLCRLCQSSISWYSSGPAQKFVLRQIKAMDAAVMSGGGQLDVGPLMLYGHILFTSTSYVYAIHYFLRALALDPTNPVITLSLGLGYIHYGLKRQSVNRQYLILQGLAFLLQYYRSLGPDRSDEANYGLGRTFQLLGLQNLALEYYARVRADPAEEEVGEGARQDGERIVGLAAAYNSYVSYVMSGDLEAAKEVVGRLVL